MKLKIASIIGAAILTGATTQVFADWSEWDYYTTTDNVEIYFQTSESGSDRQVRFGVRNRNTHPVEVEIINHRVVRRDEYHGEIASWFQFVPSKAISVIDTDSSKGALSIWGWKFRVQKL